MWFVGRHSELDVCTGFIEKVAEDGPGNYIRGRRTAAADGRFDDGHTVICFKFLQNR